MACSTCFPTMTSAERRAYNAQVNALGGERSPAGRAFIEAEHQKFKAGLSRGCQCKKGKK